ncbi:MAG: exodeoxyribonuclease-3 [Planctomycetota bacterium]|jgi:exodeoxyribonuclease-3
MQIVTWNVNSIRARMPRLLPWLAERRPEVVCLQETKVVDELFPREAIEELGYEVAFHGQKTYNGVAILSRVGITDVICGLPEDGADQEARVIAATVGDVMLLNLYVINGKEVGDEKYERKLAWLERVTNFVHAHYDMQEKVVITGDFNITFDDRDLYDPEGWRDKILCSEPERRALAKLMEPGYVDAFREFEPEAGHYTWWDFRTRGFKRGNGLRIDHFLMSPPAMSSCSAVTVDLDARAGEKPSDHAPVFATLA